MFEKFQKNYWQKIKKNIKYVQQNEQEFVKHKFESGGNYHEHI